MQTKIRLLISAAERSGDAHAANLVREVRRRRDDVEFEGLGGERLAEAGCRVHEDLVALASMGLDFLPHLRRYARAVGNFHRLLAETAPDAVVLVDSPGLNFILARLARWCGVPVIYYICPQIWAWAPWRRAKILRYSDLLLAILPFETELYRNPRVPVRYVGHPLADALSLLSPDPGAGLRRECGIAAGGRVVSLLPGSRRHEVLQLMPLFRGIVDRMALDPLRDRVLVSASSEAFRGPIEDALRGLSVPARILAGDSRIIAAAGDLVIVASGTATLEVAYVERPMLVLYLGSRLVRTGYGILGVTPFFSLPNLLGAHLLGGSPVVTERLCAGTEADDLAPIATSLIQPGPVRSQAIERLRLLKDRVFAPGASGRAAEAILDFLEARRALGSDLEALPGYS